MSIAIVATLLTGAVLAGQALSNGGEGGGGGRRAALLLAGRAALTLAFILFPATIRDAIAMLTCQQVRRWSEAMPPPHSPPTTPPPPHWQAVMNADAIKVLDGGSGAGAVSRPVSAASSSSRGSAVAVPVLVSNPFFVCWVGGGSHQPAGALAIVAVAVVLVALPAVAVWRVQADPRLKAQLLELAQGPAAASPAASRRRCCCCCAWRPPPPPPLSAAPAKVGVALAAAAAADAPPLPSVNPVLAPVLSDFKAEAW